MANDEQLAILKDGPEVWNEWRFQQSVERPADLTGLNSDALIGIFPAHLTDPDLTGADLAQMNLTKANLSYVKLSGANLKGTILMDADLTQAKLTGSNLTGANLTGANLYCAKLNHADLSEALLISTNLLGTILVGANLSCTRLLDTNFGVTNLSKAIGLGEVIHHGPSILDYGTIERSVRLPVNFLRGCGLPDLLIDYLPSILNQAISFYSCFISYSHEDKVFSQRLHDQLRGKGIRCWLDDHQMLPGDDIYNQVGQGIKLWDKVLLCASKNSLTSWWVDDEIGRAFKKEQELMKERKDKVLSLIPLNLDNYIFSDEWSSGKASQVKERMVADFTGWEKDNDKFEQAFEKLVKALMTDDVGREAPPELKL